MVNHKHNKGGIALLFTVLALLVFAFFAFMGTEYVFDGNHAIVVPVCVCAAAALTLCVYFACKIKTSRNKKMWFWELLAVLGACVILFIGSVPFSQFVYIIKHSDDVEQLVADAQQNALVVDADYRGYVDNRVSSYNKILQRRNTTNLTREKRVNSLRRRLLPPAIDSIASERKAWLGTMKIINIWNIATARNMHYLIAASDEWSQQYTSISEVIYDGETSQPFSHDSNNSAIKDQYNQLIHYRADDFPRNILFGEGLVGLLSALGCGILIAVYYFYCQRPRNKYQDSHRR